MTRLLLVLPLVLASATSAVQERRTPLRNLAPDQIVTQITYCRGEYSLTLAGGEERRFRELNLRFKTDTSAYGPERGRPALLPAGMQGDRAQLIFSSLDDLKRFLVDRCEGGGR